MEILVHPVRFYRDLLLAFRFLPELCGDAVSGLQITWRELENTARHIVERRGGERGGPRYTLFTVQVPWDRSVIRDGCFARTTEYLRQIERAIVPGTQLAIKPHPDIGVPREVETWAAPQGLPVVGTPFYDLVASGEVASVVSLSSSTLVEAQAFGIPGTRLLPNDVEWSYRDREAGPNSFHTYYEVWQWSQFWSSVFLPLTDRPARRRSVHKVNLRDSRGVRWDWRAELLADR